MTTNLPQESKCCAECKDGSYWNHLNICEHSCHTKGGESFMDYTDNHINAEWKPKDKTAVERIVNYFAPKLGNDFDTNEFATALTTFEAEIRAATLDDVQACAKRAEKSTLGPAGYITYIDPETFVTELKTTLKAN